MYISTVAQQLDLAAFSTIIGMLVLFGSILWKTSETVFRLEKEILNIKSAIKLFRSQTRSTALWNSGRINDIEKFLDTQGFRVRESTRDISNSGANFLNNEEEDED